MIVICNQQHLAWKNYEPQTIMMDDKVENTPMQAKVCIIEQIQ